MGLPLFDEVLILILVVFVLSGVLRFTFGSDTGRSLRERRLARARHYGLLRQVATVPSQTAADTVREQLRVHGIRATIARGEPGAPLRVLVFPADASTAAGILLRNPAGPAEPEPPIEPTTEPGSD